MTLESGPEAPAPLEPVYPFTPAGEAIVLYEGGISGLAPTARPGRIELRFSPTPTLRWSAQLEDNDPYGDWVSHGPEAIQIAWNGRSQPVRILQTARDEGIINRAEFSSENPRPSRLLIHWLNLPSIVGLPLAADEGRHLYSGRLHFEIDGWAIVMDRRPDYGDVTKNSNSEHVYAITHIMELRRTDDDYLDIAKAKQVVEWLRIAFSFGFERWVSPAIPVALDRHGQIVWESWGSPICDPLKSADSSWLCPHRPQDIIEFTTKALAAFTRTDRASITRFPLLFATEASRDSGFVEQRLMSAFQTIESLEWTLLVLRGQISQNDYRSKKWNGAARLRKVLEIAHIDTHLISNSLPALAGFAAPGRLDGPKAVVQVRNHLIHPKDLINDVYHIQGLAEDAWRLARYYAILLILYSINYRGSHQRLLPPWGWVGEVEPVPWAQ